MFFIITGIQHLASPEWFEPIVPALLGDPTLWVLASGAIEMILGVTLILPRTRRRAGLAMALFLIVLYSANLNMWINDIPVGDVRLTTRGNILRGIAQLCMILLALWVGDWIPISRNLRVLEEDE